MPEGAFLLDRMYFSKGEWLDQAKPPGFSRAAAWIDLLANCNQEATTATVRGIQLNLERGDCARSKLGLAERWGRSWSWITATLNAWEKDGRISVKKCDNEMTVIFVTNFDDYQSGMLSLLGPKGDQKGTSSGPVRYRDREGDRDEGTAGPDLPEQTSDAAMIDFARTWPGELASGTPVMHPDWVPSFLKRINGRNSLPHSWKRLMIASWREEWRKFTAAAKAPSPSPTSSTNGHALAGEAIWKKLRRLDDKIKELDEQIYGFETVAPELAERLTADVEKLRAERKALADD